MRLPSGETFSGSVLDLREASVSAEAVRRAIRVGRPAPADGPEVVCPPPGPVHEYVARIDPEASFDRRGALVALARTRGHAAPASDELAAVREELASVRPPSPADVEAARRRAAEAGAETERLRERVATLRGRLTAHRERDDIGDGDGRAGEAVAEAEAELSETMTRLSEVATDRIAARQRLELLESEARKARDAREERLRLQDRVGNLERSVRRSLAGFVYGEFAAAVAAVPDAFDADAGAEPGDYDGPAVAAALAVARLADVRAPVVVSPAVAGAFGGPDSAGDFLRAPVVVR
ncbi:hypothetical protein [Halopelagius fulvigenes]|uniref:Uncharacterized protein n=1 Tax=Halopelagius fulvigenes TaxID=1198324 RepID=A0ABD5U5P9_9EURY